MEEDAALREVVKKALEGKGVLAQIRASLRAAVFTVVDEHERASGVHVPNPCALGVKQDAWGRLSLQLVADFLEHWQLHQTLSILKLETDLAEEDLLPREDLESVVRSDGNGVAAAVGGNGETKSPGDENTPVLRQLLAGCRVEGHRERNGLPPGASSGIGSRVSTLSLSFRHGGGQPLPQRSVGVGERKGLEEKGNTDDDDEEAAEAWEKEEGGERELGLGAAGGGVPSRVTLRKRRAGDRVGASNGGSSSSIDDGQATPASSGAPPPPPPPAEASESDDGFAAAPSPPPSSPPERGQPLRERDTDTDAGAEAEADPGGQSTASAAAAAGEEGNGANHHDGSMDESSYHFSEDADGVAESCMGVDAAAAGMTGPDRGAWRPDDEYSPSAAGVGSVFDAPRAAGEEEEEEEGGSVYRQPGEVGVSQDDSGQFPRRGGGGGGGGGAGEIDGLDDDDDGDEGGGRKSPSGGAAAGGVLDDDYDWDGDEDGGQGDEGEEEEDDDYEDDDDFHGDDDEDDAAEEALPPPPTGDGEGLDEEDAQPVADPGWEAEIGLSAESSVAVGLGEDDDALDPQAYDVVEDAQSVT